MEGSDLQEFIGVGSKLDRMSGEVTSVYETYNSHRRNVLNAFRYYPLAEYFGLNPQQAMDLPLDMWHDIRKMGRELAEAKAKEKQNTPVEEALVVILRQLLASQVVS